MLLEGKTGLVLNVTNKNSIAWAIADAANRHGARVGVGGQNERLMEGVHKLIEGRTGFDPIMLDVTVEEQYAPFAEQVRSTYGQIDFLVHSLAFAPKEALSGRFIDTTLADFQLAMEISAYSLVSLARAVEPLMKDGGSVIALSYLGSTRAVQNYNLMGICKAALEASVRYLAMDMGKRGIRVNTLSPGPVNTVSGRGVAGLMDMIKHVHAKSPLQYPYRQEDVGNSAVYLLSDLSQGVTGQIIFIDSGYNFLGMSMD